MRRLTVMIRLKPSREAVRRAEPGADQDIHLATSIAEHIESRDQVDRTHLYLSKSTPISQTTLVVVIRYSPLA